MALGRLSMEVGKPFGLGEDDQDEPQIVSAEELRLAMTERKMPDECDNG